MFCIPLPAYNFGSFVHTKGYQNLQNMNLENVFFADVVSEIVQIAKNCSKFFFVKFSKKNLSI